MKAGSAKVKVRFKSKEYPLQGYGRMDHYSDSVENDLHARAFIFQQGNTVVALLHLECAFITASLKNEVLKGFQVAFPAIGLSASNLLFCANTTHSAPGGYAHFAFFNITTRGFIPEVLRAYSIAGIEALQKAWMDMEEASLFFNASEIEPELDVAFNRSIDSYNANKEVSEKDELSTHLALDRLMRQVRICRKQDLVQKGILNWFGVQGISIPATSSRIHPDNKGYAASFLENDQSQERDVVAAFCVEAAADVSPNYHGRGKWWPRGRYEDPYKSAYFNGFIQFEKAKAMIEEEALQIPLSDTLDWVYRTVDFSQVICDATYTHDGLEHTTAEPIAGLSFSEGSPIDNPGIDSFSSVILRSFIRLRKFLARFRKRRIRVKARRLNEAHDPKLRLIEFQEKRILGYHDLGKIPLPNVVADVSDELKQQFRNGALVEHSWMPHVLPLQLIRIGELLLVGFPGEITTVAGMRLRKMLLEKMESQGVLDVIITSCSNEYGAYTTTPEEYQMQQFEGGFTLFGIHTLAAFQTEFSRLANDFSILPSQRRTVQLAQMPVFSEAELSLRTRS